MDLYTSVCVRVCACVYVCMCVGDGGGCMSGLGYQKRTKLRIEGLLTRSRVHSNIYLQSLLLPFRRTKITKKTQKFLHRVALGSLSMKKNLEDL